MEPTVLIPSLTTYLTPFGVVVVVLIIYGVFLRLAQCAIKELKRMCVNYVSKDECQKEQLHLRDTLQDLKVMMTGFNNKLDCNTDRLIEFITRHKEKRDG